jgi:hypothetical protein
MQCKGISEEKKKFIKSLHDQSHEAATTLITDDDILQILSNIMQYLKGEYSNCKIK